MRKTTMILTAVAVMALASFAAAHEGHEHTVMGTVAVVDESHIEVHSTEGEHVSILFDEETRFLRGDADAGRGDVKAGDRVAVRYVEKDGGKYAREVRLPALDQGA